MTRALPAGPAPAPHKWTETLLRAYRRAEAAIGAERTQLLLASGPAELRIAGDALSRELLRALGHLASPGDLPVMLTIALWDVAAAGVARPLPDMRSLFATTYPFADGVVAQDGGLLGYQSPRLYALLDRDAGLLAGCVNAATELAAFDIGKPLLPLLLPWFQTRGVTPMHAACVARGDDGVLFGGKGGSGKSTTALLCAEAGFGFLGDDYVGISTAAGEVRCHSFYGSAWLERAHSRTVVSVNGHRLPGVDSGERKDSFSVAAALPGALAQEARVRALVLPRVIGGGGTLYRRLAPGEALLRLSPSTVLQVPTLDRASQFAVCAAIVRELPCYELCIGEHRAAIAPMVDQLLEDACR